MPSFPALGVEHFHVVALQNARQREDVADVVVDDQHLGAGELGQLARRRRSAAFGLRLRLLRSRVARGAR